MCDCTNTVEVQGDVVCVECGEVVNTVFTDVSNDWHMFQNQTERKSQPYQYSRTTHFRKTLDRVMGWSTVPKPIIERCRTILKGYPDNHACMHTVLKAAKLPYQHTATIRRELGYNVPTLTAQEKVEMNCLFEYFCTEYEKVKPVDRKNLPSLEYMLHHFFLYLNRHDVATLIRKRYMTPNKQNQNDDLIQSIITSYSQPTMRD